MAEEAIAPPNWETDPQLLLAGGQLVSAPLANALTAPMSFESGAYDPSRSLRENALNPAALDRSISMVGPGALGTIRAWHGTPHIFPAEEGAPLGKFSAEAIGSGEGAQAYGWGHYVAGEKKVAEGYQRGLSGSGRVPLDEAGNPLSWRQQLEKYYEPGQIVGGYGGRHDRVLEFQPPDSGGRWQVKVEAVTPDEKTMPLDQSWPPPLDPEKWKTATGMGSGPRWHSTSPDARELEHAAAQRGWKMGEPGALLEVHVLPEEHELLDWDKPLAEQSQGIQERVRPFIEQSVDRQNAARQKFVEQNPAPTLKSVSDRVAQYSNMIEADKLTGKEIYKRYGLVNQIEGRVNQEDASKVLHEAGVPGIKYLDAGSRRAREGTHNYVIFHPSNLRIVGRNGQRLEPVDYDPFAGKAP